ncbi:MAG: UDP-N-acetylmuramyl-tripeptide synthetase [Candidatus Paceibacterota bacterium]|jgi:UDP-N-acetylmuramoyl-L-alanyl-D-glutamate--2,6-diaminopimelate ligase
MNTNSFYHWFFAFVGNIIYGFPSKRIHVVGVTGTKGKSTTVELMGAVFDAAGERTAVLSSIIRKVGAKREKNMTGNTMPGRFAIQKFLREAVRARCTYAFIEVTSQGVLQHRHAFIDWNTAVFLNLAPEHIESHGSFEAYRAAKVSFFEYVARSPKKERLFLVNESDASSRYFEESVKHNYGNSIIRFSGERFLREELATHFDLRLEKIRATLGEWLLAEFNLENAAAAVAFAHAQKISWDVIEKALVGFEGVSGRLEVIQRKPFTVIVDYAHTPDSLRKVYSTLKRDFLARPHEGSLIAVLGSAGGGRDKWKRPEMGKVAGELCTYIVLTNEDPYDELPQEIMQEIKKGVLSTPFSPARLFEVVDRRNAITKAITLAQKGDVVVMTGKGSESWIHEAEGKKSPWNEREVVETVLCETRS